MRQFLFVFALLFSTSVFAADSKMGLMASLLYNVPDVDSSSSRVSEEPETGFGIGMRALIPLSGNLYLRSGAGLVSKSAHFELKDGGTTTARTDVSFLYLNIPATLYLTGMDQKLGFFGGTALNARLADKCDTANASSSCDNFDAETIVLPVVIGFDFIFNDRASLELSYEYGIMDSAQDIKMSSAVLSYIFNF